MRLFKTLLFLTAITLFSCSTDDNDGNNLPEQGNIALALSNGGGFSVENIEASISTLYDDSNMTSVTITGTAGQTGNIVITIIDNDGSFRALVNENSISIGDTSLSFYATVDFESDNFNLEIISYEEFNDQNYAILSATFSAADSNFNTMTSSILDIVLD
jgi:hypothetical protein